jgi:DNA mismatch repair protein MutS2
VEAASAQPHLCIFAALKIIVHVKLFPQSADYQLEFDKIREIVHQYCNTEMGRTRATQMRIHTRKEYIDLELSQTNEYLLLLNGGQYFPNEEAINLHRELKLLGIQGAVLTGEDFMQIRRLAEHTQQLFRWFDADRTENYPALYKVISATHYEKSIITGIDEVLDEGGQVRDNASEDLARIRMSLFRRRSELRRLFDKIIQKLNKSGFTADIEESFLNGRRVVAVQAEFKRQVKGIFHGESDTRKTTFIEPEETIELNNEIFSLESEEHKEVYRILRDLTRRLSSHAPLLQQWHEILGIYDFIRAKAKFGVDVNGIYPELVDKSQVDLIKAYHPLLLLYNRKQAKPTIPVTLKLDEKSRILVISGPNAGGKTVTLKTIGLLQMMVQAGLLVPVAPGSVFGIFKQLMIHIGDTQSIEFELSTYSSHLKHMKHFMENASGRTLFFIDELGSGSDPNLGGAFAEVILDELLRKHSYGVVTTHYLNLKVMAGKTIGIINGAMGFDEKNLLPMYQLNVGKPGSSYTFAIAERIGLEKRIIDKARKLVDEDHFSLDKLLNRTEQDLRKIEAQDKDLQKLIKHNERLKKEMEIHLDKEKHRQQVELQREQNRISEDRIKYLKEMERKLKQIVFDWRKAEGQDDKKELMKQLQVLLFAQKQKQVSEKKQKKLNARFVEVGGEPRIGDLALMRQNNQVGTIKEIRGKKAILQFGLMPITVEVDDLVVVKHREEQS